MTRRDPSQTDVEDAPETRQPSDTDRAIKLVRDFQSGMARQASVKAALAPLSINQLLVVSIGTRVTIKSLEALRDS